MFRSSTMPAARASMAEKGISKERAHSHQDNPVLIRLKGTNHC
jgi:hypothetical protein